MTIVSSFSAFKLETRKETRQSFNEEELNQLQNKNQADENPVFFGKKKFSLFYVFKWYQRMVMDTLVSWRFSPLATSSTTYIEEETAENLDDFFE